MEPQTSTTPASNEPMPNTPQTGQGTTPAAQPSNVAAGSDGNPAVGTIDLSQYFKDDEPGAFDPEKITNLVKDRDNKAKSASYFQSQYMQKNEVPETIDGYAEHFKPDSIYESAMDRPEVQETIKGIRELGLKEGLSPKAVNAFIDYALKQAVADNEIDLRTPEQIQADQQKKNAEEIEKLQPFLTSMHRTFQEQHDVIKKFLDTPSVYTNDPELRQLFAEIASGSAVGFKAISTLIDQVENSGYKALPSQSSSVGIAGAEFWKNYNAESDPVKRESMLKEYEKIQPK